MKKKLLITLFILVLLTTCTAICHAKTSTVTLKIKAFIPSVVGINLPVDSQNSNAVTVSDKLRETYSQNAMRNGKPVILKTTVIK